MGFDTPGLNGCGAGFDMDLFNGSAACSASLSAWMSLSTRPLSSQSLAPPVSAVPVVREPHDRGTSPFHHHVLPVRKTLRKHVPESNFLHKICPRRFQAWEKLEGGAIARDGNEGRVVGVDALQLVTSATVTRYGHNAAGCG